MRIGEARNQPYAYLYSFITKYPLPIYEPSNQVKKYFPELQLSEFKKVVEINLYKTLH